MISIAPSILAADFAHLASEIKKAEDGGADLLHLAVMDGHFVPNITIGPPVVASIRKITGLTLDAHLMVEEPARFLDDVAKAGANWISVHIEADQHIHRSISYIRELGLKAGVALNPGTPLSLAEEILPEVDYVLLMSVNPGFGGQTFIRPVLKKIQILSQLLRAHQYRAQIEVDGGIGADNLSEIANAGAEIIVAGSAVFHSPRGASAAVRELKAVAQQKANLVKRV